MKDTIRESQTDCVGMPTRERRYLINSEDVRS
jgi:hypothetical protein